MCRRNKPSISLQSNQQLLNSINILSGTPISVTVYNNLAYVSVNDKDDPRVDVFSTSSFNKGIYIIIIIY